MPYARLIPRCRVMHTALALLAGLAMRPAAAWQVAERDLLQSRAFTLVLHHATAVANLARQPASATITSPVPAALDRQGRFWPAFGPAAAPDLSLPEAGVAPDTAALPRLAAGDPQRRDGAQPAYQWQTTIPGQHWLVTGYSNYYGPPERLLTGPGRQQVLGLHIVSRYTAMLEDGAHVLHMAVELRNSGDRPLHDVHFRLCFTDTVAGTAATGTQPLFRSTGHRVEGAAVYSPAAHVDGFGRRAAAGHAAILTAAVLQPSETRTFMMEVRGVPAAATAELHPVYLIGLREAPGGERLWPASNVDSAPSSAARQEHRDYYRQAAVLIPAPYRFSLRGAAAQVTAQAPVND